MGELRLPADSSQLGAARRYAAEAAAAFGLDAASSSELVYAVNEAVTNAIRHGAPDAEGRIRVSVLADAERLTFVVRDCGTFLMPVHRPTPQSEHGRGLALMARFADEVHVSIRPGATAVSLSRARA